MPPKILIIACGALAHEIRMLIEDYRWHHMHLTCLPAIWHNTPEKIVPGLRQKIQDARGIYERILVAYGDCGTGGALDRLLREEGVTRLEGAHCYEFFAGQRNFDRLMTDEPGSFFMTDYLVRHFDHLIWRGLGLDRHPELLADYFGHYRRLVYLSQTRQTGLCEAAMRAASVLKLEYHYRYTGYGELETFIRSAA